jgi:DNA-binding HxlR family transcriptional regulator
VTYGLTEKAQDLIVVLDQLAAIAHKWYLPEHPEIGLPAKGK